MITRKRGIDAQNAPKTLRLSPKYAGRLSDVRRAALEEELESGRVREGRSYAGSPLVRGAMPPVGQSDEDNLRRGEWMSGHQTPAGGPRGALGTMGAVAHSPSYKKAMLIQKHAATIGTSGGGAATSHGAAVERLAPEVYSPLFTMANLNLPRDRITINAWLRNFFDLHPIVRNAITLHATYPISKLNIKCADKKVEQFFEDMVEEMNLMGALGDVALEYWKIGEKVQGSSMITMADGTLKAIRDVKVGDYVLTHLGNKKRVMERFAKPTSRVVEEHLKVYRIYTMGVSEPLVISGRHPVLSTSLNEVLCSTSSCRKKGLRLLPEKPRCSNCGKKNPNQHGLPVEFKEASILKEKDLVYAPFNSDVTENKSFTADLCYLMGFWLAEGCYCKSSRKGHVKYNGIKFTSHDKRFIEEELKPLLSKCAGFEGTTYTSRACGFSTSEHDSNKNKYDHWLEAEKRGGPNLARFFLRHCGEYSKEKRMSKEIMELPSYLQLDVLAGFIDGDGCVDRSNGHLVIATSSPNLANQIVLILRRAGGHPTVSSIPADPENNVSKKYRIKLVANESYDMFGHRLRSGKAALLRKTRWSSPNSAIHENRQVLYISDIDDITDSFNDDMMYDIEVEDDHSYIANGIAIHNCFPYAELDEEIGKWRKIIVQNPDYIHVKKTVVASEPVISLRPDAVLQRLVLSNNPADIQLRKQIPEQVLYHVRKGQNIPLDNFNVSHLKMLSSPYDVRGTSVIVSAFKDLMLYDKLREAKFAQADGLVNPITLVKVGGTSEAEYHPTNEDIEFWRNMIEEAQYDKDFKIITHAGMSIERVGASGAVLDIGGDVELIIKNIHHGLMVPQAVIDTESAVYASASIGLEVLRQRYFNFRNMIAKWLVNKVFAPISEIQRFYAYEGGMKKLIVPEVEWNQMNLYDLQDYVANISSLVTSKQASLQTLYRSLGLSYEDERKKLREEAINDAIRQREEGALAGMTLTDLRGIDPEQEIMEPLPGEGGTEQPGMGGMGVPGGAGAGGMPGGDMGMGGLPGGGGMGGGGPMGMPELAPPPGGEMGGAGAPGAGGAGGVTPPLGPGGPGAPGGGGAPGGAPI